MSDPLKERLCEIANEGLGGFPDGHGMTRDRIASAIAVRLLDLLPAHDAAITATERQTILTALEILVDPIPGAAPNAVRSDYPKLAALVDKITARAAGHTFHELLLAAGLDGLDEHMDKPMTVKDVVNYVATVERNRIKHLLHEYLGTEPKSNLFHPLREKLEQLIEQAKREQMEASPFYLIEAESYKWIAVRTFAMFSDLDWVRDVSGALKFHDLESAQSALRLARTTHPAIFANLDVSVTEHSWMAKAKPDFDDVCACGHLRHEHDAEHGGLCLYDKIWGNDGCQCKEFIRAAWAKDHAEVKHA